MKCPKCRKAKSQVIDSRPAKDRFSISRRRECLACSTRFTTFEATEQDFLSAMIRKNTGSGVTLNSMKAMLNFISNTLSTLSGEAEGLVDKVTQLKMIELRNKPKNKSDKMPKRLLAKNLNPQRNLPRRKRQYAKNLDSGRRFLSERKLPVKQLE